MDLLRNRRLLVVSLGHLFVDLSSSTVPVLLTFFSLPMGLTYAQIGLASSIYNFVSSLLQPITGWLADHYGSRWLGSGGLLWVLIFIALTAVVGQGGSYSLMLVTLSLAAVGSAAFHPQGAMTATSVLEGRETTGASIFFAFGNSGMTIGPVLAGIMLSQLGPGRFPLMSLAGIPVIWLLTTIGHRPLQATQRAGRRGVPAGARPQLTVFAIAALISLIALRSWANMGTTTFLPKFFQEARGWEPEAYGLVASMWTIGTAIGNLSGGPLAERWGRRLLVSISLLAVAPIVWCLPYTDGSTAFLLTGLGGLASGLSFSVILVLAQTLIPGGKGMASGLALGFMFASGAIGNIINGWIADNWGLTLSLQSVALVAVAGALCAWIIPSTRRAALPAEGDAAPAV